jgi:hypothetical protein
LPKIKENLRSILNNLIYVRCCEIKKLEKNKEISDLRLKDLKTKISTTIDQFNKADIKLYGRFIRSFIMVKFLLLKNNFSIAYFSLLSTKKPSPI